MLKIHHLNEMPDISKQTKEKKMLGEYHKGNEKGVFSPRFHIT